MIDTKGHYGSVHLSKPDDAEKSSLFHRPDLGVFQSNQLPSHRLVEGCCPRNVIQRIFADQHPAADQSRAAGKVCLYR